MRIYPSNTNDTRVKTAILISHEIVQSRGTSHRELCAALAARARGILSQSHSVRSYVGKGNPIGNTTRIYFSTPGTTLQDLSAPTAPERRAIAESWRDAARITPCFTLIWAFVKSPLPPDEPRWPADSHEPVRACACPLAYNPVNPGGRARQEFVMAALLKVSELGWINKFLWNRGTVPFSRTVLCLYSCDGRRYLVIRILAITGASRLRNYDTEFKLLISRFERFLFLFIVMTIQLRLYSDSHPCVIQVLFLFLFTEG